jgi:hypothetical protein
VARPQGIEGLGIDTPSRTALVEDGRELLTQPPLEKSWLILITLFSVVVGFRRWKNWIRKNYGFSCFFTNLFSDVEAEAEAPEAVTFWRKRKRLKICRFRFHSVLKLRLKWD